MERIGIQEVEYAKDAAIRWYESYAPIAPDAQTFEEAERFAAYVGLTAYTRNSIDFRFPDIWRNFEEGVTP